MTRARSRPRRKHSKTGTRIRSGRRRPRSGDSGRRAAGGGRVRIGVIADTHGLIRPEALAALQGVDAILHAGDIGGEHVLEALRAIAPVTFVRGNNDDSDGHEIVRVTIGGVRVLLTHILPRRSDVQDADIVIFGHSHLPHNEVIDGVRYFNPASAGPRRFDYPVSIGILEGDRAYHIALDERSIEALEKRMNQLSGR